MRPHKIVDILAVLLVVGFLTYAGAVFFKPHTVISETVKESFHNTPPVSSGVDDVQCTESAAPNLAHLADTAGSESWDVQDSPRTASSESGFYISAPIAQKTDPPAQSLPLLPQIEHPSFDSSGSHGGTSTSPSSPTSTPLTGGPAGSGNGGNDNGKDPASAKEPNKNKNVANRGEVKEPRSIEPIKRMINFAGQRNQSSFRMLLDPMLQKYFAPDFVWHVSTFKNEFEFNRMLGLLREKNPRTIIGFYSSACLAMLSKEDLFPPARVPLSEVQPDWFLIDNSGRRLTWIGEEKKERFYLDLRKEEVRQAVINLAVARAKHYGMDAINFDNCYWGYGVPASTGAVVSKEDWTAAFEKFFEEAGLAAHQNNLLCTVNIATKAGTISEAFRAAAPYVDGMMTEMAFHPNIVRIPSALQKELTVYEDMAKEGKIVLLFPRENKDLRFTLQSIRPIAEQYGHIYVSTRGKILLNPLYEITEVSK